MSTNWQYKCESHDPPLYSEYMFTYPKPLVTALERHAEIVAIPTWVMDEVNTEFDAKPWHWLRQHANCKIEIYNEYGKSLAEWEADNAALDSLRKKQIETGLCTLILGPAPYRGCKLPANHKGKHLWDPGSRYES